MNSDELKENMSQVLTGYDNAMQNYTPEAYATAHVAIMLNELNWTLTFMKSELKRQSEYLADISDELEKMRNSRV